MRISVYLVFDVELHRCSSILGGQMTRLSIEIDAEQDPGLVCQREVAK